MVRTPETRPNYNKAVMERMIADPVFMERALPEFLKGHFPDLDDPRLVVESVGMPMMPCTVVYSMIPKDEEKADQAKAALGQGLAHVFRTFPETGERHTGLLCQSLLLAADLKVPYSPLVDALRAFPRDMIPSLNSLDVDFDDLLNYAIECNLPTDSGRH